jgi:hypothetical protein
LSSPAGDRRARWFVLLRGRLRFGRGFGYGRAGDTALGAGSVSIWSRRSAKAAIAVVSTSVTTHHWQIAPITASWM